MVTSPRRRSAAARRGTQEEQRTNPSVAEMVESVIGCKWSVRLLDLLAAGVHRPSALLRRCPGLSAKVLNERLRKMMRFGIVERVVRGDKPPIEVEYHLTPFGRAFLRIIEEIRRLQEAFDKGEFAPGDKSRPKRRRSSVLSGDSPQ